MNISDSVEYKKKFLTIYSHGMAGYSRDQRGIVLKWAGYSGILAGYLKYWRPNLPFYEIGKILKFIQVSFGYHNLRLRFLALIVSKIGTSLPVDERFVMP